MNRLPVFESGLDIAAYIRPYGEELANFVVEEERLHIIANADPESPEAVLVSVNDFGLLSRFQSETCARARIIGDGVTGEQLEAEVAVHMARVRRFGEDPCEKFVTQRGLELEIPDAKACWGGLLRLVRSPRHDISVRILPDEAVAEGGELAVLRDSGLLMPGPYSFYSEPSGVVTSLEQASELVVAARRLALPKDESLALIEQRIV